MNTFIYKGEIYDNMIQKNLWILEIVRTYDQSNAINSFTGSHYKDLHNGQFTCTLKVSGAIDYVDRALARDRKKKSRDLWSHNVYRISIWQFDKLWSRYSLNISELKERQRFSGKIRWNFKSGSYTRFQRSHLAVRPGVLVPRSLASQVYGLPFVHSEP